MKFIYIFFRRSVMIFSNFSLIKFEFINKQNFLVGKGVYFKKITMIIESKINKKDIDYIERYEYNFKAISEYRHILRTIIHRAEEESVKKHKQRGRFTARERIDLLVDSHTPFLEFSALAAYNQYENQFPSAGIITGIGIIHDTPVVIIANDATVKGGTYIPETIKKHLRALEIAIQQNLPTIYLVDSGGIFLPLQSKVFADKENFGRIFYLQARMSALSIPQIAVVMGSCTAGGAYVPAMSDEVIMVQNQGTIFLGGPPLVKAATGEEVSAEELGGAWVHTAISGVADYMATSEQQALQICRNLIKQTVARKKHLPDVSDFAEPKYKIDEIHGIIPVDLKQNIDPYEIIARIVDGSEFDEFKANYGKTIVTGFATIMGYPVGIIANNGILFSESALKATHFIELCCHRRIPLLFLQDISGFMVGKEYEHKGIAKDGAKMVQMVANANVPKITIIMGKSYGAGNYAMSGRAMGTDFLFTWPTARIAVMGGEQAAIVLQTVKNKKESDQTMKLIEQFETESTAYYATSRLWDDGIIDPVDTRRMLALCLSVVSQQKPVNPQFGVLRM